MKLYYDEDSNSGNGLSYPLCSSCIDLNTWTNILITYDFTSGGMITYINGEQEGSLILTSERRDFSNINGYIVFGTFQSNNGSNQYYGNIDEVAVWSTILSSNDIEGVYNNHYGHPNLENNVSFGDLEAYWRFNEGSGSSSSAEFDSDLDLTIINAEWQ